MFWKTYDVLLNGLDYTQNADGSWTAEFSGGLQIRVADSSVERCRRRAFDALDEQVAAIVTGPTKAHGTQTANENGKPRRAGQKRKL